MRALIKFSLVRKALKKIRTPDNEKGKKKTLSSFIRECERNLFLEEAFNCQYIERKRHECIVNLSIYLCLKHLVEVDHFSEFNDSFNSYRKKLTQTWAEYQCLAQRPESFGKITFWVDTQRAQYLLGGKI